jgi:hypothetical protein
MLLDVTLAHKGLAPSKLISYLRYDKDAHTGHTHRVKIIGQLSLNPMVIALLQGRQIFKFGLLNKKDNKKNLKIRLLFNRMVVAFFSPYYSYTTTLCSRPLLPNASPNAFYSIVKLTFAFRIDNAKSSPLRSLSFSKFNSRKKSLRQ